MKTKFNLKKHFQKDFLLYVAGVVSVGVLTGFAIYYKNLAKDYEKYNVVTGVMLTDKNTLKACIESNKELKEVSIYARKYDSQFYDYMQSYITFLDILILPDVEGAIAETALPSYVSFNVGDKFYSNSNYIKDGIHYGIKINDNVKISNQFEFEKDINYYIFIRKNSLHTKLWNSNSVTDLTNTILTSYLL